MPSWAKVWIFVRLSRNCGASSRRSSGPNWAPSPEILPVVVAVGLLTPAAKAYINAGSGIALSHPRWEERPLLLCKLKEGALVSADELRAFMAPKVAKWWLPERIEFVDELPLTATGKLNKLALREQLRTQDDQDWFASP